MEEPMLEELNMPKMRATWVSRRWVQLRWFLSHDAGAMAQFIKYGVAGGTATGVHIGLFFLLGWRLFPSLTADDWMVRLLGVVPGEVAEELRAFNSVVSNALAFLVANAVAYILNIMFVFKKGRHHWFLEIALFYAVSGVSMAIGSLLQWILISRYGVMTTLAFGSNIFCSLMINYAMRRFVIFKG
ncbi:MAG: GtrA family protein [Kiritimatiellia bacterium]